MIRREVIRFIGIGILFSGIVIVFQVEYTFIWNPVSLEEKVDKRHVALIQELKHDLEHGAPPVLFFGDSVNFCYAPTDVDRRGISEMLASMMPERRLVTVGNRAYHMGVYDAYTRFSLRHGRKKPKMIVVPVNLRSFTTHWIMNPGWRFDDLQRYLRHAGIIDDLAYRPLKCLKAGGDPGMTQDQYQLAQVYDGRKVVGRVKDFIGSEDDKVTDEKKRNKVVFYFMQGLDKKNERVCQMLRLAHYTKIRGYKVLFYIGPVDFQTCDKLLGNERFSKQMKTNADYIMKILDDAGYDALDLSRTLGSDSFYYRSPYPDEHLNEKGRRYVAERLKERITAELGGN
jgi:hypothetical protein